jgi:hypothetical protein
MRIHSAFTWFISVRAWASCTDTQEDGGWVSHRSSLVPTSTTGTSRASFRHLGMFSKELLAESQLHQKITEERQGWDGMRCSKTPSKKQMDKDGIPMRLLVTVRYSILHVLMNSLWPHGQTHGQTHTHTLEKPQVVDGWIDYSIELWEIPMKALFCRKRHGWIWARPFCHDTSWKNWIFSIPNRHTGVITVSKQVPRFCVVKLEKWGQRKNPLKQGSTHTHTMWSLVAPHMTTWGLVPGPAGQGKKDQNHRCRIIVTSVKADFKCRLNMAQRVWNCSHSFSEETSNSAEVW